MKKPRLNVAAAVSALSLAASAGLAGPFTAGNLVVTQIFDGTGTIAAGAAAPVLLVEIDINTGAIVQTIPLPTVTAGNVHTLTVRGSATSVAHMRRSVDGRYLTCIGYDAPVGTAAVNMTSASTNPRIVARVDASGSVDTSTALTDAFSGQVSPAFSADPRSAVSTDGNDLWLSSSGGLGSSGGVRYTTFGSTTSTQVSPSPSNTRNIDIFNNQLYVTADSLSGGTFIGVMTVGTGLPTSSGNAASQLPGFPQGPTTGQSPYEFFFSDANTVYIADDSTLTPTPPALPGGIQKWTFDAGTGFWSLAYTINAGLPGANGCRGLIGKVDGSGVTLYATTADAITRIVKLVDTGAGSSFTILATAPTTTAPATQVLYRGIDFVPASAASTCYANCDNSTTIPFLNVNDFICFQSSFAAGNSYANCDNSTTPPVLNVNDFICFQSAFAAGCSAP
jgi:hypothetical protein